MSEPVKHRKELNVRQSKFIAHYLAHGNATQAAIHAGYSKKAAQEAGSEILSNPIVRQAIAAGKAKIAEKGLVDAEYVIEHLKELVARCMQKTPVKEFDYENKEMVQKTELVEKEDGTTEEVGVWEFDSAGANKALRSLGDHIALFTTKIEGKHLFAGSIHTTTKESKAVQDIVESLSVELVEKMVQKL